MGLHFECGGRVSPPMGGMREKYVFMALAEASAASFFALPAQTQAQEPVWLHTSRFIIFPGKPGEFSIRREGYYDHKEGEWRTQQAIRSIDPESGRMKVRVEQLRIATSFADVFEELLDCEKSMTKKHKRKEEDPDEQDSPHTHGRQADRQIRRVIIENVGRIQRLLGFSITILRGASFKTGPTENSALTSSAVTSAV